MSDDLKYRVLPPETKYRIVSLTEKERNEVRGLGGWKAFFLWVVIAFVAVIVGGVLTAVLFEGLLVRGLGVLPTEVGNTIGTISAFIFGVAVASVAVALMMSSTKKKNISDLERERTERAKRAYQMEVDEAKSLTSSLLRMYESSTGLATELRQHLNQASRWIQDAENEYHANAFAPFWDAVGNAVQHLAAFNDKTISLSRTADEYYSKLSGRKHTFPAFPVHIGTIPDASTVVREFQRVVRMGQTNHDFADIWELRRIQTVLIAGFRTLGEAVNNLAATLENSIYGLQQSVSSDFAKVIEEEIKTRESLDKRMIEQNRMLNNIQHRRKPEITDSPSRR